MNESGWHHCLSWSSSLPQQKWLSDGTLNPTAICFLLTRHLGLQALCVPSPFYWLGNGEVERSSDKITPLVRWGNNVGCPDCQKITNLWAAFPFPSGFLPEIVPFSFLLFQWSKIFCGFGLFSPWGIHRSQQKSLLFWELACGAEPVQSFLNRSKYNKRKIMQENKIISSF